MNKGFKPASIAFYVLMFIVFFFIGIYVAKFMDAGKNQMLAGGAIVLGWGVLFAGIALIASIFIAYYLQLKKIIKLNWALLILLLILYGITHYNYLERKKEKAKKELLEKQSSTLINTNKSISKNTNQTLLAINANHSLKTKNNLAIGFFKPNYIENPTVYFYGNINLEKELLEHTPQDSIVFTRDTYNNINTSYAPPWLFPEHLKLDYDIFIFKVLGVSSNFVKVEANKTNHQISYLDKNKGTYYSLPEFLLSVNSVEFTNANSKVYSKPFAHAEQVNASFQFMQPLLIQENWMYVILLNDDFTEQGKAWIQWKENNKLLISYNLLS